MAVKRFIGFLTDIIIWFFIFFYPMIWLMDMLIPSRVVSLLLVHGIVLFFLTVTAYQRNGQTWGQKIVSIEINTVRNESPSFLRILIHFISAYLLYLYSFGLLYIVSIIVQWRRADDRMLHDLISGTKLDVSHAAEIHNLQIGGRGKNEKI
ncbi:RDD family protein [Salibacterium aidingense]|uniref:RDD family protein n=1 Tax=Salibacterium aidingense TaxID=384933 RepID=UPI003BEA066F